ncbi:hypothetical protein [Oceanobacillus locisalsi]|uniref:DUF5590 domain-containing protein n=1 Tax=Oceanobacillus locisalsi TaxID=546107 RepID=A0ABW3NFP4_9BACI
MRESNNRWVLWTLIAVLLLLLAGIGYSIYLYQVINDNRTAGFDETKEEIETQTSYHNVHSIQGYYGENNYHVFYASNEDNEERLIFLPLEGEERELIVINTEDIMREEAMVDAWSSNCDTCQFADISPAYEDGEALWEITYYDQDNHFVMDYYSINGESLEERYTYNHMFP